jgi:signal transduction histidine kinase
MRILNTILIGLLKLSINTRLTIAAAGLVLGFIPYLFSQFNGPLLAISLALAAWLFKQRGVFISTGLIDLGIAIAITIQGHSLYWSSPLLAGFLTGTTALLVEGFFICYLRYLLERSESIRLQMAQVIKDRQNINKAYEQQQHLNQLKDRFIANISHELCTPVQAVLGHIELLQTYDGQLDASTRKESLNYALQACYDLQKIANDTLDYIGINNGERIPQTEKLLVTQVVQDVLACVEPKQLQIVTFRQEIPDYLTIAADPQYTHHILLNLLTNALKYNPNSASILIRATLTGFSGQPDTSPAYVCISVKDNGPGIPTEEIAFIFERFVRLKRDLGGSVRGTGLGLSISKELVEAMGGQIWVESSGIIGEGCCFSFTLPTPPYHHPTQ